MEITLETLQIRVVWWLLPCAGFFAGSLAGLFGVGGGILVTPFLSVLGAAMPVAVGTSIPIITGNSAAATILNRKFGNLHLKSGLLFAAFMLPTVELSAWTMRQFALTENPAVDSTLRLLFIIAVIATLPVITRRRESPSEQSGHWLSGLNWPPMIAINPGHRLSLWIFAITGVSAGLFAGFLGLGGGRIILPVLLITVHLGLKRSVGTTSLVILLSSTYASVTYFLKGLTDPLAVALMLLGAIPGALGGAFLLHRIDVAALRHYFVGLTLIAVSTLLLKQFGFDRAGLVILFTASILLVGSAYALLAKKSK